jgi:signal transduction histidine kinase
MFRRKLTFRQKLLGIAALPLALIGYLSFQDVQEARSTQQAAADQQVVLKHEESVSDLAGAIGDERRVLYDPAATDDELAAQRVEVDDAMGRLRSPDLAFDRELLIEAEGIYAEVVELRAQIGDSVASVQTTIASREDEVHLRAIEQFAGVPQQVLALAKYEVSDRGTQANLATTVLVQRTREALALEGTALQSALAEGAPSHDSLERVGALIGASDQAIDATLHLGTPAVGESMATYLAGPEWAEYQSLRDRFTRLLIGQHVRIEPTYVLQQRAAVDAELGSHQQALRAQMAQDTAALDGQALRDLLLAVVIGVGVLLLLTAFLFLPVRSIRRSLGRLERRATEISSTELPALVQMMRAQGDLGEIPEIEQIPVETNDEIGRLSVAFNELQTTALQLAGEQAASRAVVAHMFVNLGRRNQKLLMRMLELLDELEHDESDPDKLAKLYDVDHLATRMRRNAESLLILADAGVSRRFDGPVMVSELLHSTMAEVAEFERVEVNVMDDVGISGDAAADLAHLLSELTENSVKFSPPTEPIELIARYTRGGYIVAVLDSGMGLTPVEAEEANARIRAAAGSAETPSKNLGHFVVGKLAGKYGMEVEIFDRVPAGLTVRVRIPRTMIVSQPPEGVLDAEKARPELVAADCPPVEEAEPDEGELAVVGAVEVQRLEESIRDLAASSSTGHEPVPPTSPQPAIRAELLSSGLLSSEVEPILRPPSVARESDDREPSPAPRPVPAAPLKPERSSSGTPRSVASSDSGFEALFGTRRRVAGANLPDRVSEEVRPEADLSAHQKSADSVGSTLGALQRGLKGTSPDETDKQTESEH